MRFLLTCLILAPFDEELQQTPSSMDLFRFGDVSIQSLIVEMIGSEFSFLQTRVSRYVSHDMNAT
jgi:hypothetical protein